MVCEQHSQTKKKTGNVEVQRKERCGRKRKTTKRDDLILLRNSKINPQKNSEQLKRDLDKSGVHVSSSTVGRLLEKGRKARKPKKKQLLTAAMKKKRFNWAKNTKTGLKMIGGVSSFQTKIIFLFRDSIQNLFAFTQREVA